MSGAYSLVATGGGNTTRFALNAAMSANSHSALSSANAHNMRASGTLYSFSAVFAGFSRLYAAIRRAAMPYYCRGGAVITKGKIIKKRTQNTRGRDGR